MKSKGNRENCQTGYRGNVKSVSKLCLLTYSIKYSRIDHLQLIFSSLYFVVFSIGNRINIFSLSLCEIRCSSVLSPLFPSWVVSWEKYLGETHSIKGALWL